MTKHVRRNDFRRNGIRRNDQFPSDTGFPGTWFSKEPNRQMLPGTGTGPVPKLRTGTVKNLWNRPGTGQKTDYQMKI